MTLPIFISTNHDYPLLASIGLHDLMQIGHVLQAQMDFQV